MTCGKGARLALPLALLLCGCQTADYSTPSYATPGYSTPRATAGATAMDGTWLSNDGVFYAAFENGNFTSRFTQTNEVLAQGSYTVSGNTVVLSWISVATQQQRTANCTTVSPDMVSCIQSGGGTFDLKRGA